MKEHESQLEALSMRATRWIGSGASLVFHTIIFIVSFLLYFFGINFDTILLFVTTIVSLEAIYLAIFIQMSVNKQSTDIKEVSLDVEEIQDSVEDIQEDVDEIQKDIDTIQEDVDEIQEDVEEIQEDVGEISEEVGEIHEDVVEDDDDPTPPVIVSAEVLERIEQSLRELGKEIAEMKRKSAGK
jgi:uncharacterized protein YoxC